MYLYLLQFLSFFGCVCFYHSQNFQPWSPAMRKSKALRRLAFSWSPTNQLFHRVVAAYGKNLPGEIVFTPPSLGEIGVMTFHTWVLLLNLHPSGKVQLKYQKTNVMPIFSSTKVSCHCEAFEMYTLKAKKTQILTFISSHQLKNKQASINAIIHFPMQIFILFL